MGTDRGFIEFSRREPGYRPVDERLGDFKSVELRMSDADILEQAARCMDCGIPFCHGVGCPLANVIPEFNEHVYRGRWREALDVLLDTNCFPEFTGRICPAPCECSCVVGINDDPVTIRLIELAVIEKGFERGYMDPKPPADGRREERVAVVGSGPAGLAVAQVLNRAGIGVTVYEDAEKPGGILRYGIPGFKLEKWVVDRRIRLMEQEGVVFETGIEIGRDLSHRFLKNRFQAVVLTGGARRPRDLEVRGRDLDGIHFAMSYLVQQNRLQAGEELRPGEAQITAEGKNVIVIGGGDTGSDCLGTALRQGALSVSQLEILPRPPDERSPATPWPQWPDVLRQSSSHKEGGRRRWSVSTTALRGKQGYLTGLDGVEVEWTAPESGGRPVPSELPGTEFSLPAELILLAMGFVGPGRNRLVDKLGIELDERGFIRRDSDCMTSARGTFVAGDMTLGASLVVRAIADGQRTAEGVLRHLARS